MKKRITDEENRLMASVGIGEYGIDVSDVSDNFYDDFINLCRGHVRIQELEKRIEQLESNNTLG